MLVQRHGRLLYLDIPRPTKGVHVKFDYANAGIRRVNVIDYFAGPAASRVGRQRHRFRPRRLTSAAGLPKGRRKWSTVSS
ncbi:hypothetical protein OHS18_38370 [Amycolatopsis sp. NBC_00355]|uniref:hypothetical protein n=1 Tax=Amycolatopsis sp. NBC_00355 TaxID=2975957 RepID=UPI002E25F53D